MVFSSFIFGEDDSGLSFVFRQFWANGKEWISTNKNGRNNESQLVGSKCFFFVFLVAPEKSLEVFNCFLFFQKSFFLGGTFSEILESMTNRSGDFVWNFPPFGDGEVAGISCCASLQGGHLLIC